jgi:hypothetical protein
MGYGTGPHSSAVEGSLRSLSMASDSPVAPSLRYIAADANLIAAHGRPSPVVAICWIGRRDFLEPTFRSGSSVRRRVSPMTALTRTSQNMAPYGRIRHGGNSSVPGCASSSLSGNGHVRSARRARLR